MNESVTTRSGFIFLVTVWFCWGFSYPATKLMLESIDVWTSRMLIMGLAGIFLLTLACLFRNTLRVPREHWRDLVIASIFNMTIFQIGMTLGVHYFSAGRTVVIVYTMPLWAMLFAWPLLNEKPTLTRLIALGTGLTGLAILMSQDFGHLNDAYTGAACTLVGAIAFGLGTVWMKRRLWTNDPTVIAGWQLLLGSLPVIPFWILLGDDINWSQVTFISWINFAFIILVSNVLAYFAWFRVLRVFPASVSGLGTLAVPIVGVLASAAVIREQIGGHEVISLILIITALLLILRSSHQ